MNDFYTYLNYGIKQIKELGPQLIYWRFIHRQLIRFQPPLPCPNDASLEVHMQICKRDWLNGMWTIWSFSHAISGVPFRLLITHDGWLEKSESISRLYQKSFPGIVIPSKQEISQKLESNVSKIAPILTKMWATGKYFTLPKVVDLYLSARNRFIITLDPDIIFFSYPKLLLDSPNLLNGRSASWNIPDSWRHADGAFCITPSEIKKTLDLDVPVPFGTGLGCVDKQSFDWGLAERFVSTLEIPQQFIFMLDQTIFAIFAAKYGFMPLPSQEYRIEPVNSLKGVVARHYYSKTRDLLYTQAIPELTKKGLLQLSL